MGTKKVPIPLVMKVQRRSVSLMRPEDPLYFMEQGTQGAQSIHGTLIVESDNREHRQLFPYQIGIRPVVMIA